MARRLVGWLGGDWSVDLPTAAATMAYETDVRGVHSADPSINRVGGTISISAKERVGTAAGGCLRYSYPYSEHGLVNSPNKT